MDKKGQWYTDTNGNHYFVEDGQSPKEGWEASKRRKMISEGKYKVSEDGNDYREVNKDEYDNYESDETDFDETNDDDFGFDEEEDEYDREESIKQGVDYFKEHYSESEFISPMSFMEKRMRDWPGDERAEILKIIDGDYDEEMAKAQEENAAMSENEPANVDALFRPDEDKGPRESKGPADPNAPAGQVLYNSDDKEFLKDMGANLKNTQYGRQETLDEYYERVKDKHTDDMDDWKTFISTAYAMSPKEVDRYIELKEMQENKSQEEKPYNREEKLTEYLKEQGFDDDYINKTLENMKKNMNIGQFWDKFFKDKEEK